MSTQGGTNTDAHTARESAREYKIGFGSLLLSFLSFYLLVLGNFRSSDKEKKNVMSSLKAMTERKQILCQYLILFLSFVSR